MSFRQQTDPVGRKSFLKTLSANLEYLAAIPFRSRAERLSSRCLSLLHLMDAGKATVASRAGLLLAMRELSFQRSPDGWSRIRGNRASQYYGDAVFS